VAQVVLRRLLHLLEDHRRDLGRGVALPGDLDRRHAVGAIGHLVGHPLGLFSDLVQAPAHEPLDREDGLLGVGDRLALGHLAHQPLAVLGEGHHRGGGSATLGVGDDDRVAPLHDRYDRVGRAQVNADDLGRRHVCSLMLGSDAGTMPF
jgi:hypothetical protein